MSDERKMHRWLTQEELDEIEQNAHATGFQRGMAEAKEPCRMCAVHESIALSWQKESRKMERQSEEAWGEAVRLKFLLKEARDLVDRLAPRGEDQTSDICMLLARIDGVLGGRS